MQLVESGVPFNFNYPAFDQNSGLFVRASIYDVTTGSAVFASHVNLAEVLDGVYSGNFTGAMNKTYLVIVLVYTDGTYSTVDTTRAPWAECYQDSSASNIYFAFNFGTYDQNAGLFIAGDVYDYSSGSSVFIEQVEMAHVASGVYFGSYTGIIGKTYLVAKGVYTDSSYGTIDTSRAPSADSFQGSSGSGGGSSTDPGIANVRSGVQYEIDNVMLVGTLYVDNPQIRLPLSGWLTDIDGDGLLSPELHPRRHKDGAITNEDLSGSLGEIL